MDDCRVIIKTGYFSYTKRYKQSGFLPVSIAQYTPSWYNGVVERRLAPPRFLLKEFKDGLLSEEEYRDKYTLTLEKQPLEDILKDLENQCVSEGYKGVVLMCYEKSGSLCHRYFLADFLNNKYSLGVEEFVL